MQGHLAKPVVFTQLARALQRWLPTRIVEADQPGTPPRAERPDPAVRASALARSPQLVSRWQARRNEALSAVRAALGAGWLASRDALPGAEADVLGRLLHKLAGTAALFGEAALGEAARMLEQALTNVASAPGDLSARAEALLAIAAGQDAAAGERPPG
jgi:HPt (histidine-containing phosphotransfer) domain-containing protein